MSVEFNVLIIGAGIVGLSAALAMAQRGYSVAVIDAQELKANTKNIDSRVYAINHASEQLLRELGAWQHVNSTRVSFYNHMHVWDAGNGACIDFDARDIAAKNLGAIIEESILKKALLEQIALQPTISLFPKSLVEEVCSNVDHVMIRSKKQTWQGQLLMVADGANSPIRQLLKVDLTTWSYKQQALVATVSVEKVHQNTAYQVFHSDGPLAFLPLADAHQCSIVWSADPIRIKQLMNLSEEEFNHTLTQAFSKKLGQVKLSSGRKQFPLSMRHVKQYVGARWLLLGDAAHTIHPLAGQGLNVGLADVTSWIRCCQEGNFTSRKVLGAYQRERKSAVWQMIVLMESLKQLFSYSFTPINFIRGVGLNLCNKIIPIKRLLIQQARGR